MYLCLYLHLPLFVFVLVVVVVLVVVIVFVCSYICSRTEGRLSEMRENINYRKRRILAAAHVDAVREKLQKLETT